MKTTTATRKPRVVTQKRRVVTKPIVAKPTLPDGLFLLPFVEERTDQTRTFTPAQVFTFLVMARWEIFESALNDLILCEYFIEMKEHFSPEVLKDARQSRTDCRCAMRGTRFWHRAFTMGATMKEWRSQKNQLTMCLRSRQEEDWRFAGMSVEDLFAVLVPDEEIEYEDE